MILKKPKIGIIGASGMAGHTIKTAFSAEGYNYDVYPIYDKYPSAKYDAHFESNLFDFVINCAGSIPQRHKNYQEYETANVDLVYDLAQKIKKYKFRLIHLSTNCVFDREKRRYGSSFMRNTDSFLDAQDNYGRSKGRAERILYQELYDRNYEDYFQIIRTSIIGFDKNNKSLLSWFLAQKDRVVGYGCHYWNGITTLELSIAIMDIISQWNNNGNLIHLASPEFTNKYQLLCMFRDIFEKNIQISYVGDTHYNNGCLAHCCSFQPATLRHQIEELKVHQEELTKDFFNEPR